MTKFKEWAEAVWRGEIAATLESAFRGESQLLAVSSFANVYAFSTPEGLVVVDTATHTFAPQVLSLIKQWSTKPIHTLIYTHGHVDHVMGAKVLSPQRIVAHRNVPARFQRYQLTQGYNTHINNRQFRLSQQFPVDFCQPDLLYDDQLDLQIGGVTFQLFHDKGETDDATWVFVPSLRAICAGDFFIWLSPNCGNPQKVQRYPREWAAALRKMAALDADLLLPGHGPPIEGSDRVRQVLTESAQYLESIVEQTLRLMNAGASLDAVLQGVKLPPAERPYLKPLYDQPQFIVRNLWRLYGGWWDLNPSHLLPPSDAVLGAELAGLVGLPKLLARVRELTDTNPYLAASLIEFAYSAQPESREVLLARQELYRRLASKEPSLMASGAFRSAFLESKNKLAKL